MAQARGQAKRGFGGRLGGLLLATLLATLVGWSPAAVQPVLAAGPLQVRADTRYTLDPGAGRVHVAVEFTVTNNKPNTPTVIYYYRDLSFGVHPDVRQVRATDRSGSLGVSTRKRDGYTEVDVRLRANLYYRRSTSFTLRYDLVGGAPRSESPIRVGEAFATFGVWAFGDKNKGTVEVRIPKGFTSTVEGDSMRSDKSGSGEVLEASPDDPNEFFAIVSVENRDAYDDARLSFDGGIEVVVLSWPEDEAWEETVTATLRNGMPTLHAMIGLDWPVAHDLHVRERYTPALEGYAGVFFLEDQRIDVSEDLDPITILHEASHAWFNDDLFTQRWIYEGLAEEYAWRVQSSIGDPGIAPPDEPQATDPGYVALNGWRFPVIVRDETDAVELYGYGASWWLVHLIYEAAGEDGMRAAFQNAEANLTAYPGAGPREAVGSSDGWHRFLDLTQPIDEPDPAAVLDGIERFVLTSGDEAAIERRTEARAAYRELLAAGEGWLPPWYVRNPMGEWLFADAGTRIDEATAVLALRDQVEAAAATEGLALDDALETAYEGARDGFEGAEKLATDQLDAIAAIAAARAKVDAEPDLVSQLGLLGETPRVPYEAARAAFESGDLGAAVAQADAAAGIIAAAPALGQERLLLGAGVAAGILLLLLVAFLLLRRRRRRRFAAAHAGVAEPSATLGAVPEEAATPLGEALPEPEGGTTHT